jgi:preprotein translocase subunit SecG
MRNPAGRLKGSQVVIVPWTATILNFLVIVTSIFLIFLVLIQRGKGGGLAGAFGGSGGSSAFGSRAGDLFTRITIIAALIWVLLIMAQVYVTQASKNGANIPAVNLEP